MRQWKFEAAAVVACSGIARLSKKQKVMGKLHDDHLRAEQERRQLVERGQWVDGL